MQIEPNINGIQAGKRLNTIVYMGAGSCRELDALLALQPQRLLLIEADPRLASALKVRTAAQKQIQVQNTAVSGSPGTATLYRYNLPYAGSIHPPGGLLELYPGLKIVEQLQIKTESPVALLQPLGLAAEQENLLIVDLPGEEFSVLQALQHAGQLQIFRQLQVHCGRQPLYVDDKPAAQILQWLQGQGFDVLAEDDTQNQDRPCWTLQRNNLYLRNREQEKLVAELKSRIQQLTNERDEHAKWHQENKKWAEGLKAEKTQLEQQHAQLMHELKTELTQARQTATLTTKLYALREADLADLQSRYKEAVKMQERQHLLMLQLEGKLRVAAQYFHQLHNNAVSPAAIAADGNSAAKRKPRLARAAKQKAKKPGKA